MWRWSSETALKTMAMVRYSLLTSPCPQTQSFASNVTVGYLLIRVGCVFYGEDAPRISRFRMMPIKSAVGDFRYGKSVIDLPGIGPRLIKFRREVAERRSMIHRDACSCSCNCSNCNEGSILATRVRRLLGGIFQVFDRSRVNR